jgi:hypothetical protein
MRARTRWRASVSDESLDVLSIAQDQRQRVVNFPVLVRALVER